MTLRPERGVSLVEALVAMAVMAFGMLAVVGLQVTLRANGDVSKQRAEGVRIAQQSIEDWRAFAEIRDRAGLDNYEELVSDGPTDVDGINATYARTRTLTDWPVTWPGQSPTMKTLAVRVTWIDRNGEEQDVRLSTVIAGVAPELSGALAVPANGVAGRWALGRHRTIPALAKDLGDGTSAIKPPGAPDTVAWRFNNVTGLITICSVNPAVAATTADLTSGNLVCGGQTALGFSGYVRYALTASPPTEADARTPTSAPIDSLQASITRTDGGLAATCYSQQALLPSPYTGFSCVVPVTVTQADPNPGWSGQLSFAVNPADMMATELAEQSASKIKVCSYAKAGAAVGTAVFSGGGNAITLTPRPGGEFRTWVAGSRIDLTYNAWTYAYTVSAAVDLPALGQTTQTISVLGALPGAGTGLTGAAFADVWPYAGISVPMVNNNFLVIRAGDGGVAPAGSEVAFTCPASTLAHQPST